MDHPVLQLLHLVVHFFEAWATRAWVVQRKALVNQLVVGESPRLRDFPL